MIRNFRHNGLRRFWERGDRRRIPSEYVNRIDRILTALDRVSSPQEVLGMGYRPHRLTGNLAGYWPVSVSPNWRIIFRLDDGDVYDVDLADYH